MFDFIDIINIALIFVVVALLIWILILDYKYQQVRVFAQRLMHEHKLTLGSLLELQSIVATQNLDEVRENDINRM